MGMRCRGLRHYTAVLLATVSLPLPAFSQQVLPTGGSFSAGSGDIQTAPTGLLINQTSATGIVEWQDFSIGSGASVHFDNGAGATLNRVTGNLGSQIDGSLTATGSLYLVNRAGIVVGKDGVISTGGDFFASTHDVTDQQFLAGGEMTFAGSSKAAVVNLGTISSASGNVALIARAVDNSGSITAENGTVGLLAGYEILAKDTADADGLFAVVVGGSDTEASNSGAIAAANAELRANGGNVYALAGNTGGVVKATGVTSKDGRIFLTAGEGGKVEVTGKLSATRPQTESTSLPTRVPIPQARPDSGGDIRISGSEVRVNGAIEATGTTGSGGTVVVTGDRIALGSAATVDASGATGGIVLIGGDYQGGTNAATKFLAEDVATADKVAVAAGAAIRVDGTDGAGGRAVVWSDDTTVFDGTITATGAGAAAGGIVETSGHNLLLGDNVAISTRSERGATGTWLIDPYSVTISSSGSSNVQAFVGGDPWNVAPTGSGANINNGTLSAYLNNSNVAITTNGAGSEAGNITVNAAVSWNAATTLSLLADSSTGGIFINAAITGANSASGLVLSAGSGGISQAAAISAGTLTATTANGGSVALTNSGNLVGSLGTSSVDGSFSLTNGQALTVSGNVTTNGPLSLATTSGNLTVNGLLTDGNANSSLTLTAAGNLLIGKDISRTGSGAAVNLNYGGSYSLINGARISLPSSSATLTINSQAYTLIHDLASLQAIGSSGYYALAGDIDASATSGWNSNTGFNPISGFTGTFSGLGHVIDSLTINRSSVTRQGLFGDTNGATLRDVTLSNISVTGSARVGGLVGEANNSVFDNIHVTGSINGYQEAGGIAGWFVDSTLSNSSSAASVRVSANSAGGLVGHALYTVTISDSYATGSVTAAVRAGGLVGDLVGGPLALNNVYASGKVTATTIAGGLIGADSSSSISLTNAYWDGNSTGQSATIGLAFLSLITGTAIDVSSAPRSQSTYSGFDFTDTWVMVDGDTRPMLRSEYSTVIYTPAALQLMSLDLSASYKLGADIDLTGAFTAVGGYYGGLWGSSGFVSIGSTASNFTGSFNGQGHTITGLTINRAGTNYVGLFGLTSGATISNVALSGGSITGNDDVGALIGYMIGGSVSSASASATVSGVSTGEANTGGLIGVVDGGTVSNSWASGNVTGAGYQIGGLVGYLTNGGSITRSYATGNVTGTGGYGYIGGLVGANGYSGIGGTISQSYATGTVTGSGGPIGGFVGHNNGTITDSYAMGRVNGLGTATNVGGFVGVNFTSGTISNAYSTGYVTGAAQVGGFAGYNNNLASAITNAYWNVQTSGQSVGIAGGSGSATARTTAQLQGSVPAGFSSSIWGTGTNLYSYFLWQHSITPTAVSGTAYSDAGTTVLAGANVTAVSGGSAMGSAATGANGYYYVLLAPGTSPASAGVLTYLDGGSTQGAAFSDIAGTNGVQNISIYGTAAHLITGKASLSATRTAYLATLGSYSDTDLGFLSSSSFASLTTTSGHGVYLNASGNYTLDTNLGSAGVLSLDSGGSVGVSGTVGLTAGGNLTVADAVSWSDASSLTLTTSSGGNITLGGAVTAANGTLAISAAGTATSSSAIDLGLFSLTGGTWRQVAATLAAFDATDFRLGSGATFLRATGGDGSAATPYQIADVYGLQGMGSASLLSDDFVLAADIDASGTASWNSGAGFVAIGDFATGFAGSLDGAGHSISGLLVNRPAGLGGLFGRIDGTVSDLTLAGSVTGSTVGLLAGYNFGTVSNVSVSGTASAGNSHYVGGLIGLNAGTITGSHAAVTVTAGDYAYAGGLVAYNTAATSGSVVTSTGTITGSSATGTVDVGANSAAGGLAGASATVISASYATGAVTGGTNSHVGGLVGDNTVNSSAGTTGSIATSFATGAVTAGGGATATAGGLVGANAGDIADAYATGNVTGGNVSGGLVGTNSGTVANTYATGTVPSSAAYYGGLIGSNSGTATASFWNTTTSGTSLGVGNGSPIGVTGRTTAQLASLSTLTAAGWTIDGDGGTGTTWRIYDGQTGPLLRSFMTALTVTGGSSTKVYDASNSSANVGTLTYGTPGYDSSLISGTAGYTSSSANVGGYSGSSLALSGLYSGQFGYDITFVSGSLTITQRALTVTADNQSMTAGTAVPALTYTVGGLGLVGGDSLTGALSTSASSTSVSGSYAITQGTLAASANYALTYTGGTLTVTAGSTVTTPTAFPPSTVFELPSGITLEQPGGGTIASEEQSSCPAGAVMGAECAAVPHPANRSLGQYIIIGSL
ncbi:filamentous hemagglutinin N-terminal domain-containing protein [Rhizobium sp. S-51]|uniref:Filamentous hemagglutinin N-terminal domain-containing protein n=1 Tax=Rhizobium terricola TaxID=2728849 RepID=A0A7Y0AVJ9_9HYPH|nr:GLUG motif-containing protein [Rhizobium terricola]NML74177.1 filamentous hemagglutinin N-terminal domain-containing protein [Rhizobium terricola]